VERRSTSGDQPAGHLSPGPVPDLCCETHRGGRRSVIGGLLFSSGSRSGFRAALPSPSTQRSHHRDTRAVGHADSSPGIGSSRALWIGTGSTLNFTMPCAKLFSHLPGGRRAGTSRRDIDSPHPIHQLRESNRLLRNQDPGQSHIVSELPETRRIHRCGGKLQNVVLCAAWPMAC
jgi:hypothetical protein